MSDWPICPRCGKFVVHRHGVSGCPDNQCGYIGNGNYE